MACDGFGKKKKNFDYNPKRNFQYYYIDHYYSKSTEEFIEKMMRGCVDLGLKRRFGIISNYFEINTITVDKIKYIENVTLLNLSKYKEKIEKINLY